MGSVNAAQLYEKRQSEIANNVERQHIGREIERLSERLTDTARTAAITGEPSWQGHHNAYESLLIEAIEQASLLEKKAEKAIPETASNLDAADIAEIDQVTRRLIAIESEVFELVRIGKARQASVILLSEPYLSQREMRDRYLRNWLNTLEKQAQRNQARQYEELNQVNAFNRAGIGLLIVAWTALLLSQTYYVRRRPETEATLRQLQQQFKADRYDLQVIKGALLGKQSTTTETAEDLKKAKEELARNHQILQVSKAAFLQKNATSEALLEELQRTKLELENSHRDLQVSKAALSQKATTLEETLEALKQTQVQMVQTEKMSSLGQLVAGIAHEINNPVNFIYANLDPAREYMNDLLSLIGAYQMQYPTPPSTLQKSIDAIDLEFVQMDLPKIFDSMEVGTKRIRQIVLSLRNFSRSDEAGLKESNLHEGLESTLLILQHRLNEHSGYSELEVLCDYGTLPKVECYPGLVNQVFMNVLTNAIDATDERCDRAGDGIRGRMVIRTSAFTHKDGTEWVEVAIADTGTGIPDAIQDHIFDAFFTTKPVGKGTGLGLSISYSIVTTKHGGKLTFSSKVVQGAEFVIQLPVLMATPPVQKPTFTVQPPMGSDG